jgi:biotin carboxyl carrier protein
MTKFKINVNGNWHEVEIKNLDESPISVLVDGEVYRVELAHEPPDTESAAGVREEPGVLIPEPTLKTKPVVATQGQVIAPMPGKILTIHVAIGDWVQYQDVLCTLEAMKMENEIMAPVGGVVKEVRVSGGQEVMYGDVLFVIG